MCVFVRVCGCVWVCGRARVRVCINLRVQRKYCDHGDQSRSCKTKNPPLGKHNSTSRDQQACRGIRYSIVSFVFIHE